MTTLHYSIFLFDLDGTLIDTKEAIFSSFEYLFDRYLGYRLPRQQVLGDVGLPLHEVLLRYFGALDEETLQHLVGEYRTYQRSQLADTVTAFPGTAELLAQLSGQGMTCGVVTGRGELSANHFLERLGFNSFISVCIAAEHTARHKPDPQPLHHALSMLSLPDPSGVLYTGDSEWDIAAGRACGMATALARWGLHTPYVSMHQPMFSFEKPLEILALAA